MIKIIIVKNCVIMVIYTQILITYVIKINQHHNVLIHIKCKVLNNVNKIVKNMVLLMRIIDVLNNVIHIYQNNNNLMTQYVYNN